jgi:hypothetical protein
MIFNVNGYIYDMNPEPCEMWVHFFPRAWWIVNQFPKTEKELNKLIIESRLKFAKELLGCSYS